jgi:hypothetical protein
MTTQENESAKTYFRFSPLQRLLHLAVMIGFTGLAVTGFSLKFSDQWWAMAFAWLVGGAGHLAYLHRFFAVITYGCVVVHILWLFYFKLVLKGSITGPQSLFPKVQDIKDLFQHMGYFFGKTDHSPIQPFHLLGKIRLPGPLSGHEHHGTHRTVSVVPGIFHLISTRLFHQSGAGASSLRSHHGRGPEIRCSHTDDPPEARDIPR